MSNALNLLLIDGHDEDRQYYGQRLKASSPDYVIYEATTGQNGLDLYRSEPIHCVVLELDLPDMSGFQVLIGLVPLVRHPEVPVIILTHLNFVSLMELAMLNGAYICLDKDSSAGDLLDMAILRATSTVRQERKKTISSNPLWGFERSA